MIQIGEQGTKGRGTKVRKVCRSATAEWAIVNPQSPGATGPLPARAFEVHFATTYLSSSDPTIHVGLPPGVTAGVVEVAWPSGRRSSRKVCAGTLVLNEEPASENAGARAPYPLGVGD